MCGSLDAYGGSATYVKKYEYNTAGLLVKEATWYQDADIATLISQWEYSYYDDGRLEFDRYQVLNSNIYSVTHHIYLHFDGGSIYRQEWSPNLDGPLLPHDESVYDLEGRLILTRTDIEKVSFPLDCPYGKCWGYAHGVVDAFVYDAKGRLVRNLGWLGDEDYVDGTPVLKLWEYDDFGRLRSTGTWGQESNGSPYYLSWLLTNDYSCWDDGTAAQAEWGP